MVSVKVMDSVCAFQDGNVAEIDLEMILQAYTVPHRNMIINPTGRKIIRLVFFMVFFFFFFLPVHDLPAISCILLHSLASSCILLHYPARAPDSHKTISSFYLVLFIILVHPTTESRPGKCI